VPHYVPGSVSIAFTDGAYYLNGAYGFFTRQGTPTPIGFDCDQDGTDDLTAEEIEAAVATDAGAKTADAKCGAFVSLQSPANRQVILDALNSTLIAGPGSPPLGSRLNPIPLPAEYTPPPDQPHQWRDVTGDEAGQTVLVGCLAGGGTGAIIGGIFGSWIGAGVGAVGGCAGSGAASYLTVVLYKDQVQIWYPVANGQASNNPRDWYKCTDFKIRPADANHLNPWDVAQFKYPAGYPDLGGSVQPFARKCVPFLKG
jgi:hypothetical protein